MSFGLWDAALIALKTLTYAATLGAAGATWFLRYCEAFVTEVDRRRIRRTVFRLAAIALCGGAAQILVTAGSMSGEVAGMWDGALVRMVWQAGAGRSNAIRAAGLCLAALGVRSRRPSWWASVGAAMAATSFAWTGHAHALRPDVLPVLLAVHLTGVAFWLGALAPLLIVARGADMARVADTARVAATAGRFGAAALFVVAGLVVSALCLLWMLLGGAAQLWSSAYGRYVMLKLAFVTGLLCFAAFNNRRLTPRLEAGDAAALRSLRVSVGFELLLGFFILVVTAVLTTAASPPALD